LLTAASDLPMRTSKFCAVLFGVAYQSTDKLKRSQRFLLSVCLTVEICWRYSTLYPSSVGGEKFENMFTDRHTDRQTDGRTDECDRVQFIIIRLNQRMETSLLWWLRYCKLTFQW